MPNLDKRILRFEKGNRMIFRLRKKQVKHDVVLPILNSPGKYVFYCPGCEDNHIINTDPQRSSSYHTLRGSLKKPTVRASVLLRGDLSSGKPRCHLFITDGKIHFMKDSTHSLSGRIVKMKPILY
jgi:uncharacterized protein DUF6527